MRIILLIIEFDGTNYSGWQVQPNGLSIQEIIESALVKILEKPTRIYSAGRTDAGVHARRMPAHFQTTAGLPLKAFREGLNRYLPSDIAVQEAYEMADGFHARFSAHQKWYRYTIYLGQVRSPLAARSSWHRRCPLDLGTMRQAAMDMVGPHDFKAFRSSKCAAKTTVRELSSVEITQDGSFVYLDFRGSGFLKNMVRMLVGTLVEVGQGKRPADDIEQLLSGEPQLRAGATAPPQGLCLMDVSYE